MSSVYYIFRNNMSCHTDIHTHTHRKKMHMFPESALIQLGIAWELIVFVGFDSPFQACS